MTRPVVLVTGASRGIGKQLCVDFARAGFDVACVARSSQERASKLPGTIEETAADVEAVGAKAITVSADISLEDDCRRAVDDCFESFGRCDVLVNNAAVAVPGAALTLPTKRWRLVVDVNLNGTFFMTYYATQRMTAGARIINISAGAAVAPTFGRVSYSVTKAGIEVMTQGLAHELKERAISVNCLRIEVPVWSEGFAATLKSDTRATFEDPIIVSDGVLWLASQEATYTGNVLTIAELRQAGVVRPNTRKSKQ